MSTKEQVSAFATFLGVLLEAFGLSLAFIFYFSCFVVYVYIFLLFQFHETNAHFKSFYEDFTKKDLFMLTLFLGRKSGKNSTPESPATTNAPLLPQQYSFYVHQPPGLTSVFDPNMTYDLTSSDLAAQGGSKTQISTERPQQLQQQQSNNNMSNKQDQASGVPGQRRIDFSHHNTPTSSASTPHSQFQTSHNQFKFHYTQHDPVSNTLMHPSHQYQANFQPSVIQENVALPVHGQQQQQEQHVQQENSGVYNHSTYFYHSQMSHQTDYHAQQPLPPPPNPHSHHQQPAVASSKLQGSSMHHPSSVLQPHHAQSQQQTLPPPPPSASNFQQDQLMKSCLNYFKSYKESRVPIIVPDREFLHITEEYLQLYEPLANAVASLAARGFMHSYPQVSVDFKIKALNLLRHDLVQKGVSEYSIVCMLILGNIEMNEARDESWFQHLDGATKGVMEILNNNDVFGRPENYSNFIVLLDAVAYQDIVASMGFGTKPRLCELYSTKWKSLRVKDGKGYFHSLRLLMSFISEIMCFSVDLHERHPTMVGVSGKPVLHDPITPGTQIPLYYAPEKSYLTKAELKQYSKIYNNLRDVNLSLLVDPQLVSLLEGCRAALTLFLMLKVDSDEFQYRLSSQVRKLRSECRSLIEQDIETTMSISIVVWLTGITSETMDERQTVLNKIHSLYSLIPRQSLQAALKFLTLFWKMRDDTANSHFSYRDLLQIVASMTQFRLLL